ncbi:MAG: C40 family peptidase [Defluviitaleaceae bacterium]|nr:C40 family peptidase [Defluviitaleaceae bacterium]
MIKNVKKATAIKNKAFRYFIAGLFALGLFTLTGQTALADTYVTVTGSAVNVRSSPEISDANRITTVPRGTVVNIVGEYGDFFRASFPDIGYAYIAREWVSFYRTMGSLTAPAAWIYDLPDMSYGEPIGIAAEGDYFTVVSYYGNWYGVIYEGELAFIERHHLYVPATLITVPPARLNTATVSEGVIEDVVTRALRYLGTPYRWGGNGPSSFDCSGFVIYVLRPFGVTLPRRSRDMASSGVYVSRSNIQAGDLVFFATAGGRTVSHVGLYIGGGQFIHSSSSRTGGVVISNLHSAYFARTFVTARRVL